MKSISELATAEEVRSIVRACLDEESPGEGLLRCRQVGSRSVRVGCNAQGELVAIFPPHTAGSHLSVNSVRFDGKLIVEWEEPDLESVEVSMLVFTGDSHDDVDVFSHVVSSVIMGTKMSDNGDAYAKIIEAWLEMLHRSTEASTAEIIGLWGELLLISNSGNVEAALEAWQWSDTQPIDFLYRGSGLEVKTNAGDLRRHTTSLSQYLKVAELKAAYVSINTFQDSEGMSVFDLVNQILPKLSHDSVHTSKIMSAIARRVGFGHASRTTSFNVQAALKSLAFFSFDQVPAPQFPSGVVSAEWTFELVEPGIAISDLSVSVTPMAQWLVAESVELPKSEM